MKNLSLFTCLLFSSLLFSHTVSLDLGETQTNFNRFSVPNNDPSRISLNTDQRQTSFRLTGYYELKSGNQVYFLLAPLSTNTDFKSSINFEFDGVDYFAGEDTNVIYKFNSYRLGYLWKWRTADIDFWTGVVGKIRDAKIKVSQGNKTNSYSNVGFVPLASIGAQWRFYNAFSLFMHIDALSSHQGSAYDAQLEIKYDFHHWALSVGKRILGGGADNDKVNTFAQFDTVYSKVSYSF